ncbi:MAG TPA: GGDEF domain-containing phosphodiesterase [Albidovulum sp.]|uniref:putative bifunctional diguanylate cyclase/phosphodiesterase n=1 Tax=Albidovulum sp. TaxID=1872424 RepID=UPI002CA26992|nr:GGDEF domain-containing phosphodiesterase [Albidovulum sp.]
MAIRDFARRLPQFIRADVLALGPGLAAGGYFFGAEGAVVAAAIGLPLAALTTFRDRAPLPGGGRPVHPVVAAPRDAIIAALDPAFRNGQVSRDTALCVAISVDDPQGLLAQHGSAGHDRVMTALEDRISGAVREDDVHTHFDGGRFAVAVSSRRRIDLEAAIQIADRIQRRIADPVSLDGTTVHVSVSIGFCLPSRAPEHSGTALLAAAEMALAEAWANGPGAIRAFTADIRQRATQRGTMGAEIEAALDGGEIVAFFQPQLSTDTGAVTGFEALARWMHPTRGILLPAEFVPVIDASGLSARLSETILAQSLSLMRAWDRAGHHIQTVAVNFSSQDLSDPNLVARLKWELDRFDLTPQRLTVEVLETVVAEGASDIIVRNLTALAALGCGIDLDDFGTGHASIAAIRRFSVSRIKIDRAFVSGVDTDPEQQRIVAAILSMADRLGLKTLAEGVESLAEHALLAQLGCSHVQGFVVARPMPAQATQDWLSRHQAKLARTPGLAGRQVG